MRTIRTPETRCPLCQKKIDAASALAGEAEPMPGDLTICFGCAGVLRFDQSLGLIKLNNTELVQIRQEDSEFYEQTQKLREAIRLAKRSGR